MAATWRLLVAQLAVSRWDVCAPSCEKLNNKCRLAYECACKRRALLCARFLHGSLPQAASLTTCYE